jgi:hypothetical protein
MCPRTADWLLKMVTDLPKRRWPTTNLRRTIPQKRECLKNKLPIRSEVLIPTLLCSIPLECYYVSLGKHRRFEVSECHVGQTVDEDLSETSYCLRKRSPDNTNGRWPCTWLNTTGYNCVIVTRTRRVIWDLVRSASNHTETTSLSQKISCWKILHIHKRIFYKTLYKEAFVQK